jgi:HD superfamily phosphohydrolase
MRFERKGLQAISQYLTGRYFMYRSVYLHPTIKAAEVQLKRILYAGIENKNFVKRLDKCGNSIIKKILEAKDKDKVMSMIDFENFKGMDDSWLFEILQDYQYKNTRKGLKADSKVLRRWIEAFLDRRSWKMKMYFCTDTSLRTGLAQSIKDLKKKYKIDEDAFYCRLEEGVFREKDFQPYVFETDEPIRIVYKGGYEEDIRKEDILIRDVEEELPERIVAVCYERHCDEVQNSASFIDELIRYLDKLVEEGKIRPAR